MRQFLSEFEYVLIHFSLFNNEAFLLRDNVILG